MNDEGMGALVAARRRAAGLSTRELSRRTDIPPSHLSQIEHGKIALPNAHRRRALAAALGVSHVELLLAAGELAPEEVAPGPVPLPPELARLLAEARRLAPPQVLMLARVAEQLAGAADADPGTGRPASGGRR